MKRGVAALFLAMAVLGGCSTPFKDKGRLPEIPIAAAPPGAAGKIFVYERVGNQGTDLDVMVLHGLACVESAAERAATYAKGLGFVSSEPGLARSVQEQFAQAGYGEVRIPEPDGTPQRIAGAWRITGTVTQTDMRICFHGTGKGNYGDGKGQATVTVEWRIITPGRDAPVYTTSQPGFGEVLNTTSGAARILWQQAFARSVRGLLADPGFRTFVAGGSR